MPLFTGENLACLRGGRLVFAHLGFALDPGDALLLVGPNGSGKSTLLRLMAGLLRPFEGRLAWAGQKLPDAADAHQAEVAYLGHLNAVKPTVRALDGLAFWAALKDPGQARRRAAMALAALGLAGLAELPGRHLSAGQQRRLALARLLAAPGRLWLLDEPTVGLDAESEERLGQLIARHRTDGGIVVAATHEAMPLEAAQRLSLDDYAVEPAEDDEP